MIHDLSVMLRVEIRAVLTGLADSRPSHQLHWRDPVELALDCCICERTGRTVFLRQGQERAVCSSDEAHGRHPAPARITAFDTTTSATELALRAVVAYWWAPFHDAKRDVDGTTLSTAPWARLAIGYYCPEPKTAGQASIQSNLVRPVTLNCASCSQVIAISEEAPSIESLE
jgi:hypothetical protein